MIPRRAAGPPPGPIGPSEDERAQRRRTAAVVGLGLSLGATAAFLGALLQPRRREGAYDPRRPR